MFFCYLAIKSRAATANELFADATGILHTIAHRVAVARSKEYRLKDIVMKLQVIERKIPGYLCPSDPHYKAFR